MLGSKAFVKVQAEVKNYLADPDDLLKMYSTDFKNLFKVTMLDDTKLDHQFNSVPQGIE
jgi:hypothetical protein